MPPVLVVSNVLRTLLIRVLLTLRFGQLWFAKTDVLARPGTSVLVLLISAFTV